MEFNVKTLEGKDAGKVSLSDEIFGLDPREDLIARMIRYQLAKKRQGTHKTKGRSEVSRTGSKMYKQKGTGRARHHSARAPQFRGGGKAHGPVVRSHEHDLPKKVRALGLKHALSAKAKADRIASLLVKSIDGFGLNLINTKLSPAAAMATWLSEQEAPSPFMINQDCSLKDTGHSKASVRYAKHPLDIEEVRGHIVGGKQPTQLSLTWRSRVSFALTEAMTMIELGSRRAAAIMIATNAQMTVAA